MADDDYMLKQYQRSLWDVETIEEMEGYLAKGAKHDEETASGPTPVDMWATNGRWQLVRHALERFAYPVNKADSYKYSGATLLFHAVQSGRRGNTEFVKELVEKYGADIHARDNAGNTPLLYASYNNSSSSVYDVIVYLISKGAKLDVVDSEGNTVMHKAVGFAGTGLQVAQLYYSHAPQLIDAVNNHGDSVFAHAAKGKNEEVLNWLMTLTDAAGNKKFDINKLDSDGDTPLIKACGFGSNDDTVGALKTLASLGADASIRNRAGKTALHAACGLGAGSDDVVRYLMRSMRCDPNAVDNDGRTPLHYACGFSCGYFDAIDSMIDREANVKIADKNGRTPLHECAKYFTTHRGRGAKIMKLLLKNGADPNAKDSEGRTPIDEAKEADADEAVTLLTEAAAK